MIFTENFFMVIKNGYNYVEIFPCSKGWIFFVKGFLSPNFQVLSLIGIGSAAG